MVVSPDVAALHSQLVQLLVHLVLGFLPGGIGALDFLAARSGQIQSAHPGVVRLCVGHPPFVLEPVGIPRERRSLQAEDVGEFSEGRR